MENDSTFWVFIDDAERDIDKSRIHAKAKMRNLTIMTVESAIASLEMALRELRSTPEPETTDEG